LVSRVFEIVGINLKVRDFGGLIYGGDEIIARRKRRSGCDIFKIHYFPRYRS